MEDIMEAIYWIQIFLAPFLPLTIIGVIIYLTNTNYSWLTIVLMIVGAIFGIILAERIRRKYGTTTYMGRIRGNSEFIEKEEPKKDEIKPKYTCPCCGYKTLDEMPPGTYIICPVCFWEDDPVQFDDPNYRGGANIESLREAQQNFVKYGSANLEMKKNVRKPKPSEPRDENWKPY